ncbi:hypothetical protein NB724_004012 [Pantoea ananatis]|uniref:DUF2525 domain-containing protein n=1 Tax=Pantoea ananas TaxID=553 RepID=UPI00051CF9FB|nr:DUF2525 domain-containing protein [Pantoea ananatis]KGL57218.1 hypothetical protein KR94_06570 [Pantoea ananatis]MCW0318861.1 hypothetical protein [Pantoea ananatis]MCW0337029.1 hypothetical protein [Pantoea ananatis]MCW0385195.1 hypothetical protein [Pantoea ananatis]MCW0409818.1 hypothetical protein [Pantoea ananatis]
MSFPHLVEKHERDKEMDALLQAIEPGSTGELQDYFSPHSQSVTGVDAPRQGLCREPAEQCEMDIHDCRYTEINR